MIHVPQIGPRPDFFSTLLRNVMLKVLLIASLHHPTIKVFEDHLQKVGNPQNVVIIAVPRNLVNLVSALCKSRQKLATLVS
jgi:hypothetical protein